MAKKLDLYINQGTDYQADLTVEDAAGAAIDITGYSVAGSFKHSFDAESASGTLTVALQDAANGIIRVTSADTDFADIKARRYVYDITMTSGAGTVTRIFEGILHLKPQVT